MDANLTTRAALEKAVLAGMDRAGRSVMRWGVDDCALWATSILQDALGYDPASKYRGRYHSRFGALRYISANGGMQGLLQSAARRHGWKRIDPRWAKPGDIGLVWTISEGAAVQATAICRARGWFVARNERGFTTVQAENVPVAWSVLDDAEQPPVHAPQMRMGVMAPTYAANYEPVSAIIGLTALIEGLGASAAVAGVIGGAIVSATISIGFSLAASFLQPHTGLGSLGSSSSLTSGSSGVLGGQSTQASVQVTERQSLPYKRVIVGNAYVGGALFFEQVKPPYLTHGILINDGEISAVRGVTIGSDTLLFSNIKPNTILTPLSVVGQPNYPANMRICVRYGTDAQTADPLILARYTNVDSTFRQGGIATYVGEYNFGGSTQDDFIKIWGQVSRPSPYLSVDGVKIYDPRDPTQTLDDESTWKWSNNASLVQAWYLTRDFGGRIPKDKIDWDKVADAANYDDEPVLCADGSYIKRYTIDGAIVLNEKPYSVLPRLLSANRGYVLLSGGKVWVSSSRPRTPTFTIHDGIVAGGFTYQAAKAKRDLLNRGQSVFVAENQDYQTVNGPILDRTDLQATDGEVLPGTLTLDFTRDYRRAERLLKAYIDSSRLGKTITIPVDVNLLATVADEIIGSVCNVDSQLWPMMNGTYFVTGVGFADDFSTISLALTEYDASIETRWNPGVDEKPFTLASVNVS